jgi:hypothetical protein
MTSDLGFCAHDTILYPELAAKEYAGVKAMGGARVRIGAVWGWMESPRDALDPTKVTILDTTINAALTAGLAVLLLINPAPRPSYGWFQVADAGAFGRFAGRLAARYKPGGPGILPINNGKGVTRFEIGNEPNLGGLWDNGWNGGVVAGEYVAFLGAARSVIKMTLPAAEIGFAGLAAVEDWPNAFWHRGPAQRNPEGFLADAYANGAKGKFDFMCYHPYTLGSGFEPQAPSPTHPMITRITKIHDVMIKNGDGTLPIDCTEWGYSTTTWTPEKVREHLHTEWSILHSAPYAPLIRNHYLYCLRDFNYPGETYSLAADQQNYGSFRQDMTAKYPPPFV